MHPNSGNTLPTIPDRGPGRPKEFAADTAAAAGVTKRSINEHLARAEALGDDLPRVTGTSLDKGVELDALAKLPSPPVAVQRLGPGTQAGTHGKRHLMALKTCQNLTCRT